MDQFQLAHRKHCRSIVITEMVLSGAKLFLIMLFLLAYIYSSSTLNNANDIENNHPFDNQRSGYKLDFDTFHWIAIFSTILLNTVLFKAGLDVLRGCRDGADFRQAIRACKIWCWIETFRMIIFVYTFLVDVYQQSFNGRQYVITIPETIIMIFAWFFVNEYKKELSFQWGCQLPMMSQQMNGFQPPQVIYYPPSIPTSNVYNYNYQY